MITENYEEHWVPKYLDYDYPLTEQQYRRFVKGFVAGWDQRYETISVDGWHYIYRSGTWLEKFRYVKQKDSLYHISEHYIKESNAKDLPNGTMLDEVLYESTWEPSLFTREELEKAVKARNKV